VPKINKIAYKVKIKAGHLSNTCEDKLIIQNSSNIVNVLLKITLINDKKG